MSRRYNLRSKNNEDELKIVKPTKRSRDNDKVAISLSKKEIDELIAKGVSSHYLKVQDMFVDHITKKLGTEFTNIINDQMGDVANLVDGKMETFSDEIHDSIHSHFDKFDELVDPELFEDLVVDAVENKYRPLFNAMRKTRVHFNSMFPEESKKKVKFGDKFGPPKRNYEDAFETPAAVTNEQKKTKEMPSNVPLDQAPMMFLNALAGGDFGGMQKPNKNQYPKEYNEEILNTFENKDHILENLINLKAPLKMKNVIYERFLSYIKSMPGKEKDNDKKWLQKVLKLPFDKRAEYPVSKESPKHEIRELVNNMFNKLNEEVHGLYSVKEEIIVEIMKRLLNPENKGAIIVLEGDPGIGKTYMAHNLASIIGLPFESISLGGCKDADILNGNDPVYVGSHEGAVARALQKMGVSNGLLYLDEIDKIGDTQKGDEVSYALLSILDETQNYKFNDNYFCDIDINLSRLLVIGSVNDREKINPILRDRMKFIKLPTPTFEDKVEITVKHFIPKFCKLYDISPTEMIIPLSTVKDIVRKSGDAPGVRDLKRDVDHIISRFNFLKNTYTGPEEEGEIVLHTDNTKLSFALHDFTLPYTMTPETVDILKGPFNQKKELSESVVKMYL